MKIAWIGLLGALLIRSGVVVSQNKVSGPFYLEKSITWLLHITQLSRLQPY